MAETVLDNLPLGLLSLSMLCGNGASICKKTINLRITVVANKFYCAVFLIKVFNNCFTTLAKKALRKRSASCYHIRFNKTGKFAY